jgi:hypothetical protein
VDGFCIRGRVGAGLHLGDAHAIELLALDLNGRELA